MLRVVIDTNHIMSAILSDRGASAKLIDWMVNRENYFQWLISQPIWEEYYGVADWLIPPTRQLEKQRILRILREQARWVTPALELQVCPDPDDNRFLECAVAGKANYLVTKNIRHFPPKRYGEVNIVRISDFLRVLEQREELKKGP
ncbi:MAG: putative toxin-antitoxin system toxin component, PIN family [Thiotrichaceae bacterium IS1]|nr:MAG: putative toxin-antitoxin system toxin component, PIN family [Thiotrichaceae bacterium IS1]